MRLQRSLIVCALPGLVSCSEQVHAPAPPSAIPQGAFAVVGDSVLRLELLSDSPLPSRTQEAEGTARDELFRKEAAVLSPFTVQSVERGVLARRLIEHLESESAKENPVTDAELEEERNLRWLEFNRPRAVRTVQVLFEVAPLAPDDDQRKLAHRVHEAVQGSHNLNEFAEAAKEIIDEDQAAVYEMPPLSADGRVVPIADHDHNVGHIQEDLAKAAAALRHPGEISEVIASQMGFHIFFATEVIPPERRSTEEVRDQLRRSLLARRIAPQLDELTKHSKISVVRKRDDMTQLLTRITEQ